MFFNGLGGVFCQQDAEFPKKVTQLRSPMFLESASLKLSHQNPSREQQLV